MEVYLQPNGGSIIRKDVLNRSGLIRAGGENDDRVVRILDHGVIILVLSLEWKMDSSLSEGIIDGSL